MQKDQDLKRIVGLFSDLREGLVNRLHLRASNAHAQAALVVDKDLGPSISERAVETAQDLTAEARNYRPLDVGSLNLPDNPRDFHLEMARLHLEASRAA